MATPNPLKIRHNPAKYERRKAIRAECSRRLQAARRDPSLDYSSALAAFCLIRDKIRRYYDVWGFR